MTILCDLLKNQYLVLLLFLCHNVSISNVLAEETSRRITTSHGERFVFARAQQQLELECPVHAWGTASHVEWWKGSMYLSDQNEYTITQEGLLVISSLTTENSGTYSCIGVNGYGLLRTNVTIIVDDLKAVDKNRTFPYRHNSASLVFRLKPVVRLYLIQSAGKEHNVGEEILLHCMAQGWPVPRLFFFKDELLVQDTEDKISNGTANSVLRLHNLQKTDAGAYKCIAMNEIGDDVASHTLHVTDPEKRITTSHGERFIFAHEWQPLKLACPVQERGIASHIEWWKGSISLGNQSGYFITVGGFLVISSLTKENTGTYTCAGTNSFGLFRTNITVIVDDLKAKDQTKTFPNRKGVISGFKPVVRLYLLQSTEKEHNVVEDVLLHCMATGWPVPRLFFFKDELLVQDTEDKISNGTANSVLRLRYLQETDAGAYKCIAMNEIGDDVASRTLHVTDPGYPPRITSVWPTEVKIEEGSSTVFWCEVTSSPGLNLTIKWLKILNKMESAEPFNRSNVISLKSGDVYYRVVGESHVIALEGVYKFKLTIENAVIKSYGLYICLASNSKGSAVKHTTLLVKAKPSSPSFAQKHPQLVKIMITVALFIVVIGVVATTVYFCRATKRCCTKRKKREIALSAHSVTKEECETLNQISTPSRITPVKNTASLNIKPVKYTTSDDNTLQMHTILNNATPRMHTELLKSFPHTYAGISAPRYKTKLHWSSAYDDSCSDFDFD